MRGLRAVLVGVLGILVSIGRDTVVAVVAWPRWLLGLAGAAWLTRRHRRRVAEADPVAARTLEQLDALSADEILVKRYCLVDAQGQKLPVEGMPGTVALFRKYGEALARRRKGERIQPVRVPRSQLRPTRPPRGRDPKVHVLLAVCAGAALALTACGDPPSAPRSPVLGHDVACPATLPTPLTAADSLLLRLCPWLAPNPKRRAP